MLINITISSEGDHAYYYRSCLQTCPLSLCPLPTPPHPPHNPATADLTHSGKFKPQKYDVTWVNPDPILRIMQWDCMSECRYTCMHSYLTRRYSMGGKPVKFHGKWPFVRVLGAQEILSSLASLANGAPHAYYLLNSRLREKYAVKGSRMYHPMILFSLVAINSWFWSAVFHARDTEFTESADYFFATSQLMYSFWLAAYRISGDEEEGSMKRLSGTWGLGLLTIGFYVYYLWSMKYVLFDYGWHMKINGVLVASHFAVWLVWCLTRGKNRKYSWKSITFLGLVLAAATCEVFDFPPVWGILDAHAAWHLMTAPMLPLWYGFWADDAEFEGRKRGKGKEKYSV